jgi:hypothetical protein
MIYGAGARWTAAAPKPSHWEHQLSALRADYPNFLDAKGFADRLKDELAALD